MIFLWVRHLYSFVSNIGKDRYVNDTSEYKNLIQLIFDAACKFHYDDICSP